MKYPIKRIRSIILRTFVREMQCLESRKIYPNKKKKERKKNNET